ncbi:hypothetical protein SAMN05421803_12277 [Nocardiopsis flavescens]|uniref:Uncharacterized protein n=1 Tax=Nocardiopsis flavescens TaxID=758803 RepID=A0A1M6T7Q5_9ACTN|nr:hypothetical protein [Nocardiopsis flavescens]SHK53015.1 hypothetical protein SAMN05421803_12277 [Nocardiopsis flavescens]
MPELWEQEAVPTRPVPQSEADVVFATGDVDPGDDLVPGVPAVAAGDAYGIGHRVWTSGIGVLGAERTIEGVRGFLVWPEPNSGRDVTLSLP